MNSFVYMAQVCEHLADFEKALTYASAALETDLTKAGTHNPSDRIIACLILGRAHVALRHIAKGAAAFESAAAQAHRYGYYLWECFALRDLKTLILDQKLGHSNDSDIVHGSRRLGAALRCLNIKGPATVLSSMLKGCDATQLMALPAPDEDYQIIYEVETAETALRQELQGLRLKELRKRAREAGVDEEALED
eukprot:COSAG06_NODE_28074_length_581_cov_0.850622_1_plen_193_part_11